MMCNNCYKRSGQLVYSEVMPAQLHLGINEPWTSQYYLCRWCLAAENKKRSQAGNPEKLRIIKEENKTMTRSVDDCLKWGCWPRLDQYGDQIPNDLVLLPSINGLTSQEIEKVDKARWYDADGHILASAKEIDYLSEGDLESAAGIKLEDVEEILLVDRCLHRYGLEDGFYHA